MPRSRHKLLCYSPGLISLVVLPLLFLQLIPQHEKFNRGQALEVNIWNPKEEQERLKQNLWLKNEYPHEYNRRYKSYEIPPVRKYVKLDLNGVDKNDRIKLDFAQLQAQEIIENSDTLNGIHIAFSNKAKYWSLVKAFDMCQVGKINMYFDNNSIWIYEMPKDTTKVIPLCATGLLANDVVPIISAEMIAEKKAEKRRQLISTAKEFTFPLSILGVLLIVGIWEIVRTIRNTNNRNVSTALKPSVLE